MNQERNSAATLREPLEADNAEVQALKQRVAGLVQDNRLGEAIAALQEGIRTWPSDASLRHDLGAVFGKQGKPAEAAAAFREALRLKPQAAETLRNLVVALAHLERREEVADAHRQLVALSPNSAPAHRELGNALRNVRRYKEAVEALEQAGRLNPEYAEAFHDQGLALADAGESQRAKAAYQQALELKPNFPEALNNMGVLCEERGELNESIELLRRACELRSTNADAHNNLGVVLAAAQRFDEAIACYRRALAIDSNGALALNNLGNALRAVGQYEEATASLRRAIRLRPDYAEAYNNLAIVLAQQGKYREALPFYDQAIYYKPNYPEAHMNRALDWLATGKFASGWIEYEWRWCMKTMRPPRYNVPRWDGSSPAGKRILVHYEQGLGDTFQFIRYASELKKLGATVIADVQKPLVKLLSRYPDVDEVVTAGSPVPALDAYAPLLSLPGLMGTTLETIPADVPYLTADADLVEQWRARLEAHPGFRVAIGWQGNPDYRGDRHRSIPLRLFAPLAKVPGVQLISLQKGFGTEQIAEVAGDFSVTAYDDVDGAAGAFMDTAAIMKCVDLVITSDTALAHLAGALGVPTWMALPISCDWRWLYERDDTPWYPTMQLFRQQKPSNWLDVFERMGEALARRVAASQASKSLLAARNPVEAERCWQRGLVLAKDNKLAEAETAFRAAIGYDDQFFNAHHDLAVMLAKQRRVDEAVDGFRRALELNPRSVGAFGNLGLACLELGQLEEAISHLERALALGPCSAETYNNLGVAYMRNTEPKRAEAAFEQALRIKPDYPEAHLNLARALLLQGNFEQGWIEYEWRWKCAGEPAREYYRPRWGGEPLGDRTLLLRAEQGLGDTLQFVRYAECIKRGGGRIVVECQPPLQRILASCPGIDKIVPVGAELPPYDVHAPLMSLPGLLKTSLDQIPVKDAYLFAEPALVENWKKRLESIGGLRIGIAWQGNPGYDGDAQRSIPLSYFGRLARMRDVRLISLQHGAGVEQLAAIDARVTVIDFGADVDARTGAFVDTAAIIKNLDLVVTSDTAVAHLAGALGVPVWLLLQTTPDFRWLLGRDDSPWYPTMRIFRQRERGNWAEVFERVATAIDDRRAVGSKGMAWKSTSASIEAAALHQEGREAFAAGNYTQAAATLERAIWADPKLADAHVDLGAALAKLKQKERAIVHFERAVELNPQSVTALANLGLALLETGDAARAATVLTTGLQYNSEAAILRYHLGTAKLRLRDYESAAIALETAIRLDANLADAHFQLGNVRRQLNQKQEALASYRRALELQPELAEAQNQLGIVLAQTGDHDAAVESYGRALKLRPDHAGMYNNLGVSLADLHREREAIAALQRATFLQPDNAEAHKNLAIVQLLEGKFEQGWQEYEWRFRADANFTRRFPGASWDGGPLSGRTLFIHSEQGLGDMIQFVRYANLAKQQGARVIVECQAPLKPLFANCAAIDEVLVLGEPLPAYDYYCAALSLPLYFQTTLSTVPSEVPYLRAEDRLVEKWRDIFGKYEGKKVGIAWQGSQTYAGDAHRSIPLRCFKPLANRGNVRLISLQKGFGAEQVGLLRDELEIIVPEDLDGQAGPFMDTAAIMNGVDLVITSDSAIAHLAGALGVPVWLALCRYCDWRWLRGRDDSPWYPTMRIFRQEKSGEWEPVLDRMVREIAQ